MDETTRETHEFTASTKSIWLGATLTSAVHSRSSCFLYFLVTFRHAFRRKRHEGVEVQHLEDS